jgi:hypothetical protein
MGHNGSEHQLAATARPLAGGLAEAGEGRVMDADRGKVNPSIAARFGIQSQAGERPFAG